MTLQNLATKVEKIELHPVATVSNGANAGASVDISQFVGDILVIVDAADMGSANKVDVEVKTSSNASTGFASFSPKVKADGTLNKELYELLRVDTQKAKEFIRVEITSTNATGAVSVTAVGCQKYG